MKLYFSPGACSLGIHVMLEEIGKPYETERVNLQDGEQFQPMFAAVNPKSKIPVLKRDDGSVLTEYGAIANWLGRTNPAAALIPHDPEAETRAVEAIDYIVATIHMQGFARVARPMNFTPDEANKEQVQARGREIYCKGMGLMNAALAGKEWIAGDYSFADPTLFYAARWATRAGVDLPTHVAAHLERMKQRPAVRRTLAAEGLS